MELQCLIFPYYLNCIVQGAQQSTLTNVYVQLNKDQTLSLQGTNLFIALKQL